MRKQSSTPKGSGQRRWNDAPHALGMPTSAPHHMSYDGGERFGPIVGMQRPVMNYLN
jgi:hypothetical protein